MRNNILIDLLEYLRHTDIFKFILPIIDEYVRYTFKNNEELKEAVNEWCNDRDFASIKYGDISLWITQFITDMSELFLYKKNFNDNIVYWDTRNVKDMSLMFCNCHKFNQPLNWDTSNVTDMVSMFAISTSFNQPLNWDTCNVTDMSNMF